MKIVATLLCALLAAGIYAQEAKPEFDGHKWEAPYHLPAPKNWGIERFPLPISFAPQIPYTGVEDIRFTPGWAKKNSPEYWSYAFLWWLNGSVEINTAVLDSNLKTYYTGLAEVNGGHIPREKFIPVTTSFKKIKTAKNDMGTFSGTIYMLDYMSQKPVRLHAKVHVRACPGKNNTFVFFELSPQPFSHKIWRALGRLWQGFKCNRE